SVFPSSCAGVYPAATKSTVCSANPAATAPGAKYRVPAYTNESAVPVPPPTLTVQPPVDPGSDDPLASKLRNPGGAGTSMNGAPASIVGLDRCWFPVSAGTR